MYSITGKAQKWIAPIAFAIPAFLATLATGAQIGNPDYRETKTTTEDCVAFDPDSASAVNVNGDWSVAEGMAGMLNFGADETGAARAVEVIRHYHFTRECFVRRPYPHMMYWKNGVAVPPGNMPGQDCIALRPEAVETQYVAGGWKVIDGDNWILDYGADRAAAEQAAAIIRTYSFNRECFVARPHVTMQYWLAE